MLASRTTRYHTRQNTRQKQKGPLLRGGRKSLNSLWLDSGPSPICGAVRKSPAIRVGRELHGEDCSGSARKGKAELVIGDISGVNGEEGEKKRCCGHSGEGGPGARRGGTA